MARKKADLPKKQASGGARLKASGKHPVLVGFNDDQFALLREAAKADGRPMTQFLMFHGLAAAEKILKKLSKDS